MLGKKGAVMTTLDDVIKKKSKPLSAEEAPAAELVRLTKEQGLSLAEPGGLLKQFTRTVLETALNEEITSTSGTTGTRPTRIGNQPLSATGPPGRKQC